MSERVSELLAPLAAQDVDVPDAGAVFWRSRVTRLLESESERRSDVLRPLRALHQLLGVGSIGAALAFVPLAPVIGVFALSLSAGAAALGIALLAQTASGRLS